MNTKKRGILILIIILLVCLLGLCIYHFRHEIINFICYILKIIKNSNNNIIQITASILGGIITGIVTFIALIITIKHENKVRKDNERIQIMPYLKIEESNKLDKISIRSFKEVHINNIDKVNKLIVYVCFENIGLGNIRSLVILKVDTNRKELELGTLKKEEKMFVKFYIYEKEGIYKNIQKNIIKLAYEDLLGNYYEQYFTINYGISNGEYYYIDNGIVEDKKYYIPLYYKNKSLAKQLKKQIMY